ncbi:MAG: O-antigen ligase family protein [bacterium]|nr:O-antigen ligase family protein [bacterium]
MPFLEKIAKWIIIGGVVLLSFSPFFVTPETAFPAVFIRVIITRLVIEVMVVFYVFLALFFPLYRPRKSAITYAVGAFLFAFLLSTIFGINSYRSFWGSHERMEGYVTLLHFGALFMVLYGTFRRPEEFKKVLWMSVVVSVAQCFYAFGQIPAINIQSTKLYANETSRISGAFGNATIFALYLVFQTFFSAMLFFWERKSWMRWTLGIIFLINIVAIIFSGTRGAMFGVAAGIILIGLGYMLFSGNRRLQLVGGMAIALIIGTFVLLYIFQNTEFVRNRYLLQRMSVFTEAGSTITSRSVAWKIGIRAWKDRFWLGYGMENFNYAFNRYYNPRMIIYDSGDFDRPHNRFVESVVSGGFIGIVAHLSVFLTTGWFLLRKWFKKSVFFFPLAALSLLLAYAMQLSTLFDHMISYQFFAIFLALIATWQASAGAVDPQPEIGGATKILSSENEPSPYGWLKFVCVIAVAVGMGWFAWIANVVPAQASYWAQVASNTNYTSQGKAFPQAFEALKKSFDLNTYLNVDMRLALSGFASSQARAGETPEEKKFGREVLEYLAGQFEKNLTEHHPDIKDFLAHQTYARIAQNLAEYDSSWNEKALKTLQDGTEEYPKKFQLIQGLARLFMQRGQAEDAVKVFEKYPLEYARGDFYFDYAATLYSAGRNEDAWKQIERAMVDVGYGFSKNLPRLVDILLEDKQYKRIIQLYEYQLKYHNKGDTQLMASLAQAYYEIGDIPNARRVAEQLLEVDPEHRADIEAFLRELEQL